MKSIFIAALAAFSVSAFANGTPEQEPESNTVVTVGAVSGSKSASQATAKSQSASAAKSKSRSASSASQSQEQSQDQVASADNALNTDDDVTVSSDDDVNIPRNTPPVFLPNLITADCGAGASAGASGTGGAGALSGLWRSKRCYALHSAVTAFGTGDYETGCVLMNYVNREAFKAMGYERDCKKWAAALIESTKRVEPKAPDMSQYATKEELDRAFRLRQGK